MNLSVRRVILWLIPDNFNECTLKIPELLPVTGMGMPLVYNLSLCAELEVPRRVASGAQCPCF